VLFTISFFLFVNSLQASWQMTKISESQIVVTCSHMSTHLGLSPRNSNAVLIMHIWQSPLKMMDSNICKSYFALFRPMPFFFLRLRFGCMSRINGIRYMHLFALLFAMIRMIREISKKDIHLHRLSLCNCDSDFHYPKASITKCLIPLPVSTGEFRI